MSSPHSPPGSPANESIEACPVEDQDEQAAGGGDDTITISDVAAQVQPQAQPQDHPTEERKNNHYSTSSPSPPPADVPPFDWDYFESRYEKALQEADEEEMEILNEAEALAKNQLLDFHQSHFSADAVARFGSDFLNLTERKEVDENNDEEGWEGEVDDGLGYYEDGVKRTLTDEQIEIFRHSELRDLDRRQEQAKSSKLMGNKGNVTSQSQGPSTEHDGVATHATRSSKKRKKKARKDKQEKPKPDLRKRTWDVVDAGLDSLDYD
ncbi:uncharacterized protein MAM_05275 [Metarhizium album ARSEF 1941]|uniref:Uncharacterized protein n=1 Tax=Metarhizium album (strain ARSEF 1941) TaxID=1081103 RepID=A0A0B2WSX9_METAS|nr:uncharacterized protein MAM_05275 [Metarhizium album ARSEF 1941]KHN96719.1 hypothetical protein MAM_05275 [Metarhizium album ARSEF 1941]